jgi:hypothetical protein
MTVPQQELYGTYSASYPFGKDTLTLNRDGTFVQHVVVNGQTPATVRGRWQFDPRKSRVDFYGSMWLADGTGQLRTDWRTIAPGLTGSLSAERLWGRINIGSGEYPYIKE